jgi:hypothetical protein
MYIMSIKFLIKLIVQIRRFLDKSVNKIWSIKGE